MFCCNGHKGAKFPLTPRTYYVPMKNDSALVSPFVTAAELESEDHLHLTKEEHSSREWIELVTEFSASHGLRSPPSAQASFGFTEDGDTGGEEPGDGSDDVFLDASADILSSTSKGAGAFKMLASSRLDAIKSFLPVANLFGPVKQEISDVSIEASPSFPKLVSSVDSLLHLVPDGFAEIEDKMKAAVKLLEDEMGRMSRLQVAFRDQVVGSVDASAFVEEFGSVCAGVMRAEGAATNAKMSGATALIVAEDATARAVSAKADVKTVSEALQAHSAKTAKVLKAFVDRFNDEIAALAQRAAPAASAAHRASPSQEDSPNSLHLAGYHDRATKRFTTGRNVREYERLTRNGFVKVVDFVSEDEARDWLRQKNGAPTAPTPSSPNPRDELACDSSEGGIAAQISDLTSLLHTLESKLDSLEKASAPTLGVSLDKFSFDTIDELVALIRKENIPTTAFGVAVDPVSFFCHHKSGRVEDVKHSNEMKAMKLAGISNISASLDPSVTSILPTFSTPAPAP
jgi:hypothetical protein